MERFAMFFMAEIREHDHGRPCLATLMFFRADGTGPLFLVRRFLRTVAASGLVRRQDFLDFSFCISGVRGTLPRFSL